MPSSFDYLITDTVNNMVACDQIRLEVFMDPSITASLLDGPNGVMCTKVKVFFNFDGDVGAAGVTSLGIIVSTHTGDGLPSPDEMESISVLDSPDGLSSGSTFYADDGNEGPGPVWFDGTDWRWYVSGNVVAP